MMKPFRSGEAYGPAVCTLLPGSFGLCVQFMLVRDNDVAQKNFTSALCTDERSLRVSIHTVALL